MTSNRTSIYKRTFPILLALILSITLAAPALAQEGGVSPPETATELVAMVLAAVGAILAGGTLGNLFTDRLKAIKLPFLSSPERARLGGLMAEIAALVVSAGLAWVGVTYLTPLASYLDESGIWAIVLAAWPVARYWFVARKRAGVSQ